MMFRGSANTGFRAPTLFDRYGYRLPGATTTTSAKWDDPVLCPSPTPAITGTGTALPGYVASTSATSSCLSRPAATPTCSRKNRRASRWAYRVRADQVVDGGDRLLEHQHDRHAGELAGAGLLPRSASTQNVFVRNPDGTLAYIDNTTMNLGGQKAAGIDVSASYAFPRTIVRRLQGFARRHLPDPVRQPAREDGSPFESNIGRFGWPATAPPAASRSSPIAGSTPAS
jgi:iron complex outermembrane receptor protein